jgi:tetratricopeptide (TPR) repeat protein
MNKKYKYLIIVFLIVASFIAFGRIAGNDFTNFDDTVYVTTNQHVQTGLTWKGFHWAFTNADAGFWHPLTWLSLMLDYQLYGLKAGGYHMTSLMLHVLTTLLLFWLFHRMTGALWRSAFVAALFAIHPLHVESVAWIAERKDTLSGFFWMLTLCLYVYYTEKPIFQRYLLVLLSFVCGLMSKSMLVTLPVIMIMLDYWPLQRLREQSTPAASAAPLAASNYDTRRKTKSKKGARKGIISVSGVQKSAKPKPEGIIPIWQLKEKIPFFLLSIIFMAVTFYAQHQKDYKTFSLDSRILNAFVSYLTYLSQIFWPLNLAVFYPFPDHIPALKVLAAVILLLIITIAVILAIKRLPYFVVGWFWFLVTLAPVIGIIQVGKHAMADRYMYLSSIGISIMLAWGMPLLFRREDLRKILLPMALSAILVLSVVTWRQCGYWENSIELFNHALNVTKNNYLAHTNLGVALAEKGELDQAVFHYQTALQIQPDDGNAHFNLANALQKQGKTDEAIVHYREAVKYNPNYSKAHNNLGVYLETQGLLDEAIVHYREALRIEPNNPGFHFNLGIALGKEGNLKAAIEHFQEAIYLKPDYIEARRVLRLALDIQQRQNR